MSFVNFLKQWAKIGIGYGLGIALVVVGLFVYFMQANVVGAPLALVGFVLMLFGVYSEREFQKDP